MRAPAIGAVEATPRSRQPDRGPKALGVAFDGLVRSPLMADAAAQAIAERFLDLWSQSGSPTFTLSATALSVDGVPTLQVTGTENPWILPAFMAGLRSFRPRPDVRPAQLRTFAEELFGLRPQVAVITRFRDWLWGDGAEGIDIVVQSSFMEAADAAVIEDAASSLRARALERTSIESLAPDAPAMARRDLDVAARLELMQAPVERLLELQDAPFPGERAGALAAACDDGVAWAQAIVDAALANPELRASMPAARLGRQAALLLTGQVDARALEVVARLGELSDGYGRAVAAALDDRDLGRAVAGRVEAGAGTLAGLVRLAGVAPPRLFGGIAEGLIRRAVNPAERPWVVEVARKMGPERLPPVINPGGLPPEDLHAYAQVLAQAGVGAGVLGPVLASLAPPLGAKLYGSFPDDLALSLLDVAVSLAAGREPGEMAPLLERVAALTEGKAALALGRYLKQSIAAPWPPRLLERVLSAVARRRELQAQVIVPLARDGNASTAVRLGALRALTDPAALAAATAWRLAELMDPPEVKARLKELRAAAREGGR